MNNRWDEKDLAEMLKNNPEIKVLGEGLRGNIPIRQAKPALAYPVASQNKYKAKRTEYNGKFYPSKKEAQRAMDNDLRIKSGDLSFYLEQVPFLITQGEGAIIYRMDFVEFEQVANTELYEVHFIEVKGYDLPIGKMKRKLVEQKYSIHIEVV